MPKRFPFVVNEQWILPIEWIDLDFGIDCKNSRERSLKNDKNFEKS